MADNFFFQGDFKSAAPLYAQAQLTASHSGDRQLILLTKANSAKLSVKQGGSQAVVSTLRKLAEDADSIGLKYLSAECSLYLAEALINAKNYTQAREELQRTLSKSEKLGLRSIIAQSHYLLARSYQLTGSAKDAEAHLNEARRALEEIHKEAGTDTVLNRSDLAVISAKATG